ncbi:MAG: GntR family transcriptional regulator [Duncaniella sp.]|nr:GntR family transcriptional regulator [Duncaniella sp.]
MVKIGTYNTLRVVRNVDFGAYLADDGGTEILLPARYIDKPLHKDEKLEVFVYKDNEGRLICTTEHPFAQVGEFAFLQVTDVNHTGAFLDWGLMKELLVPYSEQTVRLSRGMVIPVYVYLDDASKRVVASAKIDKFLGNVYPDLRTGDKVKALIYKHTDNGYKAIVNNLYHGIFYENELYSPLVIGEEVTAYVNRVRPDGKIDLLLNGGNDGRIDRLADTITARLQSAHAHTLHLSDSSSPEAIRAEFGCSKKDFKKALGSLYKSGAINLLPDSITLR